MSKYVVADLNSQFFILLCVGHGPSYAHVTPSEKVMHKSKNCDDYILYKETLSSIVLYLVFIRYWHRIDNINLLFILW